MSEFAQVTNLIRGAQATSLLRQSGSDSRQLAETNLSSLTEFRRQAADDNRLAACAPRSFESPWQNANCRLSSHYRIGQERFAFGKGGQICDGDTSDLRQRFAGQESLMRRDQHIGKSKQSRQIIILQDLTG